jgi:hypothetical protein
VLIGHASDVGVPNGTESTRYGGAGALGAISRQATRVASALEVPAPGGKTERKRVVLCRVALDSDEAKTGTLRSGRTPIYELGTKVCSPITQPNTCFSSRSAGATLGRGGV